MRRLPALFGQISDMHRDSKGFPHEAARMKSDSRTSPGFERPSRQFFEILAGSSLLLLPLLVLLTGCEADPLADGFPADVDCSSCHGDAESAAPPVSVSGETDPSLLGVGAHRNHLEGGEIHTGIECESCHLVPDEVEDEGHIDPLPAELTFGGLALLEEQSPSYNHSTGRCANTYCHGGSLAGGTATDPIWNVTDGSQITCDSCHGNPPPSPHPVSDACAECHPGTVNSEGKINLEGGQHVNGSVDLGELECNACHGGDNPTNNPAPPLSVYGSSDTSTTEVGAHQSHVNDGSLRKALECSECHIVPETMDSEGHIDESPAEVTWGTLTTTGGLEPVWDRVENSCSNTYCHGASLEGGSNTAPIWTSVGTGQTDCGTCHGAPPPEPHPQESSCHDCHSNTVLSDGSIDVEAGYHMNGTTEVVIGSCSACHGNDDNSAPPMSVSGSEDTTDTEVGAHQTHVKGGSQSAPMSCDVCHIKPETWDAEGHIDDSPAEVVFAGLAVAKDSSPTWDRDSNTCSNVYCHGATLRDGSNSAPIWNDVGNGQAECGACHGVPPSVHFPYPDCSLCHPGSVTLEGDELRIDLESGVHMDGEVTLLPNFDCDACHGDIETNGNSAPPPAIDGAMEDSDSGVGAHQAHLKEGDLAGPMDCEECHVVPQSWVDSGHIDADTEAELNFGSLANAAGANAKWDSETRTCSNLYCHGDTLPGGLNTTPLWTGGKDEVSCGSCHAAPPSYPHPDNDQCGTCHTETMLNGSNYAIDVEGGKHVNGVLDPEVVCTSCHGSDDNPAPPQDTHGNTETSARGVGAHRLHLGASDRHAEITCDQCHIVPPEEDWQATGHVDTALPAELTWGSLATNDSASPSIQVDSDVVSCSNVYCHGATLGDEIKGSELEPIWNTASLETEPCGTCHLTDYIAATTHTHNHGCEEGQECTCNACHSCVVDADNNIRAEYADQHVDGKVNTLSSTLCP